MIHGSKPYKTRLVYQLNSIIVAVNPAVRLPLSETLITLYFAFVHPTTLKWLTCNMVNCSTGAIAFLPIAVKNVFDKNYFPRLSLPLQCKILLTADTLLFCVLLSISPWFLLHLCAKVWLSFCSLSQGFFLLFFCVFCNTMKRLYSICIHYSIYIYIYKEEKQSKHYVVR